MPSKEIEEMMSGQSTEWEEQEVELEMPTARTPDGTDRERHGVRLELSVPRYRVIKKLLDDRLAVLKEDITSEEFFAVFDLANYIRIRAKSLKNLDEE